MLRNNPLGGWTLLLLSLFTTGVFAAAPAGLDESFGNGGVSLLNLGEVVVTWPPTPPTPKTGDLMEAYASAPTADGGVVVVGTRGVVDSGQANRELQLVKLTAGGVPDLNFGTGGRITFPGLTVWYEGGLCLAVQPDGKIVFGVRLYFDPAGEFFLVRVNPDGTLDSTFGSGGVVFPPTPERFFSRRLILLPDGKMLLAATTFNALRIMRLLPNGALDTSFGTQGFAKGILGIQNNHAGQVPEMCLQPDGKILVNAISFVGSGSPSREAWSVARFTVAGAIDPTFGSAGYVHWAAPRSNGHLSDFVLLNNGEILMANEAGTALRQYSATGSTFASFDHPLGRRLLRLPSGKVVGLRSDLRLFDPTTRTSRLLATSGMTVPLTVTADQGGGFLVTGWGPTWDFPMLHVTRYDANGDLVPGFGTGGRASYRFPSALTPPPPPTPTYRYYLYSILRLQALADGRVAAAFGGMADGQVIYNEAGYVSPGRCLFDAKGVPGVPQSLLSAPVPLDLSSSGEFVFPEYFHRGFARIRLGDAGPTSYSPAFPAAFGVEHFEHLSTGDVLAAGYDEMQTYPACVRLLSAGRIPRMLRFPGHVAAVNAVRDRAGGWIVAVEDAAGAVALCHVLPSFLLDAKFGTKGFVKLGSDTRLIGRQPLTVLGDGRIVVATFLNNASLQLQVLSPKGIYVGLADTGKLVPGQTHLTTDTDGRLVFAGSTEDGFAIHRLEANGTLDPGFGGEVANGQSVPDEVRDLTRAATGEWWVGGSSARPTLSYPFVAKFKPEPVTASLVDPDAPVKIDPGNKKLLCHTVRIDNHTDKAASRKLRVSALPLVATISNGVKVPGKLRVWDIAVPGIPAKGSATVTIRYVIPARAAIVFQPTLELVP